MANEFQQSLKQQLRHILGFHSFVKQSGTTWLEALLVNWRKLPLMLHGHSVKTKILNLDVFSS